ncbi:MAG: hypothetical protein GIKADHBN_01172 [Phycisphaerales bacterium]|nr:hypothetical protein [Phycisphaerales bacterium]
MWTTRHPVTRATIADQWFHEASLAKGRCRAAIVRTLLGKIRAAPASGADQDARRQALSPAGGANEPVRGRA